MRSRWLILLALTSILFCSCRWGFDPPAPPDAGQDAGDPGADPGADPGPGDAESDGGEDGGDRDDGADDGGPVDSFQPVSMPTGGEAWRVSSTRDVPANLYVLMARYRVFRSTDGAQSWSACTDVPVLESAFDLAAVPEDPEAVYVSSDTDLLLSTDGGQNWVSSGLGMPVRQVVPRSADDVWAVAQNGTIWRYAPGPGWQEQILGLGGGNYVSLAFSSDGQTLLVPAEYGGVARSTDGGQSWGLLEDDFEHINFRGAAIDPADSQHAYVAERINVYRTTDGGDSWTQGADIMESSHIAMDPGDPGFLLIGQWNAFFFSDDFGATVTAIDRQLYFTSNRVQPPIFDPGGSGLIYAPTGRGLFSATQPVLDWQERDNGIVAWDVHDIRIEASGQLLLASNSGVMVTDDDGQSWQFLHENRAADSMTRSVTRDLQDEQRLCISTCVDDGVACSYAGGPFNQLLYAGGGVGWCVSDLAVSGQRLYGACGIGLAVSTNAGTDWNIMQVDGQDRAGRSLLVDWAGGPDVLIATDSGIYFTSDDGQSFTHYNQGLVSLDVHALGRLSSGAYLAGTGDGLYLCSGLAQPWTPMACQGREVTRLLVHNDVIVAVCDGSVYTGTQATSFTEIPGVAGRRPNSLGLSPSGDLLVGTRGYGLFRAPFPG